MRKITVFTCAFLLAFACFSRAATVKQKKETPKKNTSSSSTLKYYEGALKYHKANDYKNAIAWYNAAIKTDRQYWKAWLGLGICYYNTRKYSNARLIFKYVLSLKPGQPTAIKYYSMMSKDQAAPKRGEKKERRTKGDMMWRSALLPGLGQFYNDELAKGYLYTFSYLASIAAIVKYTIDQQAAVDAYMNATADFDAKYEEAEKAGTRVWIPVGTAVLVMAVSVLDAFLSGTDEPVYFKPAGIQMRGADTVAFSFLEHRF